MQGTLRPEEAGIAASVCPTQKYSVSADAGRGLGAGLNPTSTESCAERPLQQLKSLCF